MRLYLTFFIKKWLAYPMIFSNFWFMYTGVFLKNIKKTRAHVLALKNLCDRYQSRRAYKLKCAPKSKKIQKGTHLHSCLYVVSRKKVRIHSALDLFPQNYR